MSLVPYPSLSLASIANEEMSSVTTSIGQVSYFATDLTIEKTCQTPNPYDLSPVLYRLLLIQRFCNRVHQIMKDKHDDDRPMLLKLLEQDLETLTGQVRRELNISSTTDSQSSRYINQLLLSAELQLETYHLFDDSDTLIRRRGVINAYGTALRLIHNVQTSDKQGFRTRYLPGSSIFICYLAAIVLMKVANSSYSQYVEVEAGKEAFNFVISMSRDCCVEDNDLMGRMSKILTQLWNVHRSLAIEKSRLPSLKIKSRSLYSIVHDSLWLWRERFGGQSGDGAPSLPSIIVPGIQLKTGDEIRPSVSSSGPLFSGIAPGLTTDAGSFRQILSPSSSVPNSIDVNFMTSPFGTTQEEQDWMWNIGLPSFNGMDLDLYASNYNMNYNPQYRL